MDEQPLLPRVKVFQSTLSVRRATCALTIHTLWNEFQSTLSVRRATDTEHAVPTLVKFQSTLSVRRATWFDWFD